MGRSMLCLLPLTNLQALKVSIYTRSACIQICTSSSSCLLGPPDSQGSVFVGMERYTLWLYDCRLSENMKPCRHNRNRFLFPGFHLNLDEWMGGWMDGNWIFFLGSICILFKYLCYSSKAGVGSWNWSRWLHRGRSPWFFPCRQLLLLLLKLLLSCFLHNRDKDMAPIAPNKTFYWPIKLCCSKIWPRFDPYI